MGGFTVKLHPLTSEQARFIWARTGYVYVLQETIRHGDIPVPYDGGDYIEGVPGYTELKTIKKFSRREDYPK